MRYISTKNNALDLSFREVLIKGLPDDGGLFFPKYIPKLPKEFFEKIEDKSFTEIAYEASKLYIDDIDDISLRKIVEEAIDFPAPVVKLSDNFSVLELFYGRTLAFKDFGARFLACTLSYYMKEKNQKCTILVATSGDTGSAVASGFFGRENIDVVILYPSGNVSKIQEQQLTTFGGNITAFEIKGTFDDCQRLVKTAFLDNELNKKFFLTSANSINIGRLLPQSFYYINAWKQVKKYADKIVFVVPSGNLGNLTSGLLAKEMGLPIEYFVSALNVNDVFLKYIETDKFNPVPSIRTISNAMDVGNPSNLERIRFMYKNDNSQIRKNIHPYSYNDDLTRQAIRDAYKSYNYIFEPHGAVGYLAAKDDITEQLMRDNYNIFKRIFKPHEVAGHSSTGDGFNLHGKKYHYIILETAHPGKFLDEMKDCIDFEIQIPERLEVFLKKKKSSVLVEKDYTVFKDELLKVLKTD
jgi:threonine synthase